MLGRGIERDIAVQRLATAVPLTPPEHGGQVHLDDRPLKSRAVRENATPGLHAGLLGLPGVGEPPFERVEQLLAELALAPHADPCLDRCYEVLASVARPNEPLRLSVHRRWGLADQAVHAGRRRR